VTQASAKTSLYPSADRRLPDQYCPQNVLRVAEALADGLRDPEFLELVCKIDTGPLHVANKVELFFNGHAAFASIHEAINAARKEVLIETYILRDDSTGFEMREALNRAVARGVTVRVLADAFGSSSTKTVFWDELRAGGIQAHLFHPLWSRLWDHFHRDHRKLIVVDQRVAFTGGMNIGNEYGSSRNAKGSFWRDTQVRMEGPIAWELAGVVREGWERAGGDRFEVWPWEANHMVGAKGLVVDSRPGRGQNETSAVMSAMVGASRRRLWVTNAYFAPRSLVIRALISAARRNVDVRLLLPGQSDVPIVRHAGHGFYAELLANGVRIFEYQPAVLHEKSVVADDFVTVIGSSNLDFRSFRFNAECNVMLFDELTAGQMTRAFEADIEQSVEIRSETWKQRPVFHRIGDALARFLSPAL
jgi:cardiolipin synthase